LPGGSPYSKQKHTISLDEKSKYYVTLKEKDKNYASSPDGHGKKGRFTPATAAETTNTQPEKTLIECDEFTEKYERFKTKWKWFGLIGLPMALGVSAFLFRAGVQEADALFLVTIYLWLFSIQLYKFISLQRKVPEACRKQYLRTLKITMTLVLPIWVIWLFAPYFVLSGFPKLNGTYKRDWRVDADRGWQEILGPYQEQIWSGGKLISFKQWDRNGQLVSLAKYGYKSDGTTDAPLTKIPFIYRINLDPYGRWMIWDILKRLPAALFKKALGG